MEDELERQIRRQFLQPWYEADEEGKKTICSAWKNGDKQAEWIIQKVLEHRYRRLAVELCKKDEILGEHIFDRTFHEFEQDHRRGILTYLNEGQFLRSFKNLLTWRLQDVEKSERMTFLWNALYLYETLSEGEEDETMVVDTIPGDIATPEQLVQQSEIQKQLSTALLEKLQSLSPALQDTLRAMHEVVQEVQGDLGKHELMRRTREKLGISDTTLVNRVHRIKQALADLYQEMERVLED
jgi:hypothetical protein